jgi:hypothetical protein
MLNNMLHNITEYSNKWVFSICMVIIDGNPLACLAQLCFLYSVQPVQLQYLYCVLHLVFSSAVVFATVFCCSFGYIVCCSAEATQ